MQCPVCRCPNTKVLDSRDARSGASIRRRRLCTECGHRFTTHESIEEALPFVVKRSGDREPFDRVKVLEGLKIACRKRPVPPEQLQEVVTKVEQWAATRGEREVPTSDIGERILFLLRELDEVAYVRFASVYRSFRTIQEFEHLLREMEKASQVDAEGQRTLFEDSSEKKRSAQHG